MDFREVLSAVDPTHSVRSARQLAQRIGEEPRSLRRLMHRALAWRMQDPSPIRHVFVLMLENRSFDHIFGYSGIVGRDSVTDATTKVDDLNPHAGTNINPKNGEAISTDRTAPFSLDKSLDVEHEFTDVVAQLCGPAAIPKAGGFPDGEYPRVNNSGFVADIVANIPGAPPKTPMQCFDPPNLPVLNKLAGEFAICDAWFASIPGPTWPNRFFVHAASPTNRGQVGSPSDENVAEAVEGVDPFRFPNGTIYDRLAAKGLQHRVYSGNDCPQVRGIRANSVEINRARLSTLRSDLQNPNFGPSYVFIEPDYGTSDVKIGPVVVFRCNSVKQNDMHPPSDVRDGEALIKQVYETIRNSPVWNQSVLVVLFDEHGGFFDHVFPPRLVLRLIPWGNGSRAPNSGTNQAVLGFDDRGVLHIRIFDACGNLATDTDETKLSAQGRSTTIIAQLKQQVRDLGPPHVLSGAEKAKIIGEVRSLVGRVRLAAVPPGDGAVDHTYHFQFDQLGVRVPALVVSPWVGRNVVDHTPYDHSSLLATVEKLFGLAPLTERDAAANDFLELFTQIAPRADTPATLPSPAW